MRQLLSTACFICIIASLYSCTEKQEETPSWPPEPEIQYATLLVGSGIDSLPLEAKAGPWTSFSQVAIAPTWETKWAFVQAPDGAPLPTIHGSNSLSARATGLALGWYAFEVQFSTKYGTRKQTMKIKVVPDISAGTQLVFRDLEWSVSKPTNWLVEFPDMATTGVYNRSDLFFFRGSKRFPTVEYQDPQSGQWIPVQGKNGSIWETNGYEEGAYFDIVNHSLDITLIKGITADWLKNAKSNPVVRLTY